MVATWPTVNSGRSALSSGSGDTADSPLRTDKGPRGGRPRGPVVTGRLPPGSGGGRLPRARGPGARRLRASVLGAHCLDRGGGGADLDLARQGLLLQRDADGQDPALVGGLDPVGVDAVRQPDAVGEGAHDPLPDERRLVLAELLAPPRADAQHAAVDGDLKAVGVDAGQVEAELDLVRAADGIHPDTRGGLDAAGPGGGEGPASDPAKPAH